jgi:hypothetical protein
MIKGLNNDLTHLVTDYAAEKKPAVKKISRKGSRKPEIEYLAEVLNVS